ncbi:hypothetical protein [Brevibacillus parabrevis]|nr:hypothetical protein [Brevibacillus parabrevis]
MNKGEYTSGFTVKAASTKLGKVYVVPTGTAREITEIEQVQVGSA